MGSEKHALIVGVPRALMTQRFWARVEVMPVGCWKWKGGAKSNYAVLSIPLHAGDDLYAHVFSFFLHNGRWPAPGKIVCHTRDCTSKECVNPDHLYEGTHLTNAQDREAVRQGAA